MIVEESLEPREGDIVGLMISMLTGLPYDFEDWRRESFLRAEPLNERFAFRNVLDRNRNARIIATPHLDWKFVHRGSLSLKWSYWLSTTGFRGGLQLRDRVQRSWG
jgi:hypothetical protein